MELSWHGKLSSVVVEMGYASETMSIWHRDGELSILSDRSYKFTRRKRWNYRLLRLKKKYESSFHSFWHRQDIITFVWSVDFIPNSPSLLF